MTSPLNHSAGVGQVDGLKLFEQYSSGEQSPGSVNPVGWDFGSVSDAQALDYALGELMPGSTLAATLTWYRHVGWTDNNANQRIDSADKLSNQRSGGESQSVGVARRIVDRAIRQLHRKPRAPVSGRSAGGDIHGARIPANYECGQRGVRPCLGGSSHSGTVRGASLPCRGVDWFAATIVTTWTRGGLNWSMSPENSGQSMELRTLPARSA